MRRRSLLISLGLAVVSALVLFLLLRSKPVSFTVPPQQGMNSAEQTAKLDTFAGGPIQPDAVRTRTNASFGSALPNRSKEGEQVGKTVSDVLQALVAADRQGYASLLASQRLDVDRASLKDDAGFAGQCMGVHGALVDSNGIEVRILVKGGKRMPPPPQAPGTSIGSTYASKPRGEHDVLDPITAHTDVIEVLVPSKLRSVDSEFAGRFGIVLTRRPQDGVWIVTSFTIRDAPAGAKLVMPPL